MVLLTHLCVCLVVQSCLTFCNPSGLPFPPPGNLSNPGIKPTSPVSPLQVDSLPAGSSGKPTDTSTYIKKLLQAML